MIRPREILKPASRRFMMLPHVVISGSMSWGVAVDRASFSSPIFGPIFEWAPITFWGWMFFIAGVLSVITVITASWKTYIFANLMTLSLSLLWIAALFNARFGQGIDVSTTAFGLWGFVVCSCIVLALSPTRVIQTR